MYLVEGNPGAGKTTLGLHFLRAGLTLGERVAYVVLAESERALRRLAASHGWSMEGIHVIESSDNATGEDQYSLFHPGEIELGQANETILGELDRLRPARVVIDSLSEVRLLAQDALRYRRQILTLRHFLEARDITALLLDFVGKYDDRQLESLCHGIVHLEQLAPLYGGQRRRLRVTKLRESSFRDGYHDFSIAHGGMRVYPRLVAAEHARDRLHAVSTCSSGVVELDAITGGGLDRGTSTLILGPAGAGKSTLAALHARAAVDRGEKAAFFVFDESPNTLIVRAEGLGIGMHEHLSSGNISIRQVDPAEMAPGEFAHLVRAAVEEFGASMVVIDSVNGYTSAMPEERFLHAHLHELLAFLNQREVLTILIMTQAGVLGSTVTSPIDLSYLADTVILLRYFEIGGELRQAISCLKRRTGWHERTTREMRIDNLGVHIGQPISQFHGILSGNLVHSGEPQPAEKPDSR